jgi:hypothetical protein
MTFRITDLDADTAGDELEQANAGLVTRLALTPRVSDQASLAQAKLDRQDVADRIRRVATFFQPLKASAYALWQTLIKRERTILDPLHDLDAKIAGDIRDYHDAEQRDRRRLEQEAAEAARQEAEARAIAEAAALERTGDADVAEAVINEAIAAPAPIVSLPDPSRGIVTFTRRWHWKYAGGPMDIKQTPPDVLRRALDRVPIDFHAIDEKKIGAYVRTMKGSGAIAGIDIYFTDEPNR